MDTYDGIKRNKIINYLRVYQYSDYCVNTYLYIYTYHVGVHYLYERDNTVVLLEIKSWLTDEWK